MKISLFVDDLALNSVGRAYPIAKALLKMGHQIEVLGLLVSDDHVNFAYRDSLHYTTLRCRPDPLSTLRTGARLAALATGDVIYAFKPLLASFFPALWASKTRGRPLILDVDDDEIWFEYAGFWNTVASHIIGGWRTSTAFKFKALLHPFTTLAKHKTVVSTALQKRYGGDILLHGPDEDEFNPSRADIAPDSCRARLGLPKDKPLILFVGTPHKHKGIATILAALQTRGAEMYEFVLVAPAQHPATTDAQKALGPRCHVRPPMPNSQMPLLLQAVDVVVTPQMPTPYAAAQVPAKLLEALAMGKSVIASRVGDLPLILGEHDRAPRGWVIEPNDHLALAATLSLLASNPAEATRRRQAAREFFLAHASTTANTRILAPLLTALT